MFWTPLFSAEPGAEIRTDALNPSERCGQCHEEIYAMWRRSMHSGSYTDPIFLASYMQAYLETGGAARQVCLRCHAPVAVLPGAEDPRESAAREGIACDYCHSVVSVDLENEDQPLQIKLDGIKRGPLGDAQSPAHKVARSPLHQSAEFCAGCHEYTNPEGLPIFTTYSEWKLSPQAAQGKTCQHCHMPATPGRTVRSGLGAGRTSINLHDISGMHSSEQVRKAATARILRVEWQQPRTALVEVEVANIGSGHSIPTGLPTRRLVLEAVLYVDGIEVRRFERSYQKALLDADGHPITEDHRTILAARKLLDDNRLRAGERRIEKFFASVLQEGRLKAEVRLRYSYEPMLLSRQKILIEITSQRSP
jgi:DNA-directed RNA polymerase subunit RPC12/RpoP